MNQQTYEQPKVCEELHRFALENILDPIFITDDEGRFRFISPNVPHILGYSIEEIEAMGSISKLFRGSLFDITGLAAHGKINNIEAEITDKHGENHLYLIRVKRISIYGGTVLYVCRDITERERVEEELQTSEKRFRKLFDRAPVSIWDEDFSAVGHWLEGLRASGVHDLDAFLQAEPKQIEHALKLVRLVNVNETTLRMFEVRNKEELLRIWTSLFTDETLRIFTEELRAIWESRNQVNFECSAQTAKGRPLHYLLHWVAPLENGRMNLSRVIVALIDITERKQAEEALVENQKRLDLALDSAGLGMWDFNPKTFTDTHYNDRWFTMLGYEPNELPQTAETLTSLLHPDDREKVQQSLQDHLKGKIDYSVEFRLRTKDGSYRWIHSIGKVVQRDAEGKPSRMIGIHRDISDEKRAEEDRIRVEAQLLQAQKMEAMGTLAGGIAHDFNNILAAMIGYTEMAMDSTFEQPRAQEDLRQVLKAGIRARDLVYQILAFSRQTEQVAKPIKMKLVVKEATRLLRASIPTTIEMMLSVQSDSSVMVDPTQIHQVLMNLCTNAAHAMEEKGGVLEVSLEDVLLNADFVAQHEDISPGLYVRLIISDTGHGMDPETVSRIFEPYFSTKEKGEGTGLGLSVVHGIVTSHGGAITVYSEPGLGTTFHVYLPAVEEEAELEAAEEQFLPTGSETVLFVDDELPLVNLGKQMLEGLGYGVVTRTSSLEALEVFRREPGRFDLVITDMTMPTMTGGQLATELLKIRSDIPVILCTGFSRKISEQRIKAIGIRAFLMKPFLRKNLAKTVRKVLDEANKE